MSTLTPPDITSHGSGSGTVLAFDFGERRIGVAVGDLEIRIAHPLTTIEADDNRTRFAVIAGLIAEWHPVTLVVGIPLQTHPAPHEVARLARRFARRLQGRFGIETHLVDERLTSHAAQADLREQGVRGQRAKHALDAAAAQHILQTHFNSL